MIDYRYQTFIETKWLGPTDHKPSRVKAWVVSNPKAQVTVSWDADIGQAENHLEAALKLYEKIDGVRPKGCLISGIEGSGYIFTAIP